MNLHFPNLGTLLGLGFRVWSIGSRDKGLRGSGFRVQGVWEIYRGFGKKLGGVGEKWQKVEEEKFNGIYYHCTIY